MNHIGRALYLAGGGLSLILAVLGVFLPVLPTTPFLILAAFCFSRSSHRLHQWLLNQRLFGPMIRDWETHGVIRRRAKWLSTLMMLALISYPLVFMPIAPLAKLLMATSVLAVLAFIWTRPSEPKADQSLNPALSSKAGEDPCRDA